MVLTLDEVPVGVKVKVISILGGHGIANRLMQMGLTPGTIIEVVNNIGPIIVKVRGTTIALGRGMARKVIVERV